MELIMALMCEDARTNPDGKLDIHGVFNDLFAPGFPARQPRMVLVMGIEWDRNDDGRYKFLVDLEDSTGRPVLTLDGHTDVDRRSPERPPARTRLIMPLEQVVFPKPGAYRCVLRLNGVRLQGPALHVILTESSTPEEPATEPGDGT